jgi:hypothetical protein
VPGLSLTLRFSRKKRYSRSREPCPERQASSIR